MTREVTRPQRLLAGALALTLALASSATCFAGTLQMPDTQEKACCAMMGHDCGSAATLKQDCCVGQSPAFTGILPIVASDLGTPSTMIVSMIAGDVMAPRPQFAAVDPDISPPSGTPTYLFVSVFRL